MHRWRLFLAIALAFVASVLLSLDDREPDSTAAGASRTKLQEQELPGRSSLHRGIVSASWRGSKPAHPTEDEYVTEVGSIETPPGSTTDDGWEPGIPDEVRERLARDYVGLDIAVARPPRDGKGQVRE